MYIVPRQILKVVDNWSIISTALATLHIVQLQLEQRKYLPQCEHGLVEVSSTLSQPAD